jgi:hypothetical protein
MRFSEETIRAAAFRFEHEAGDPLGEFERAEIAKHGIDQINPQILMHELQRAALNERETDSSYRQQIYWALGKIKTNHMKAFFTSCLRLELRRDMEAVYQIMIGLDNIGEKIFSPTRNGYSGLECELNRQDAEAYLSMLVS